jgi:hypothetical protein
MNALTDGYGGGRRMSTTTLIALSVVLALVVVVGASAALFEVRRRLHSIAGTLATLAAALSETVESEHPAHGSSPRSGRSTPQFDTIARRAARHRREGRRRRREEAPMTLWWIGDSRPVRRRRCRSSCTCSTACSSEARGIVPSVDAIAPAAAAGSKDLDAAPLLLTTQRPGQQTIEGAAGLRRLARRDPRRRGAGERCPQPVRPADRGRRDRARPRLLPRLDDRRAAPDHGGLDEAIGSVGEIIEKTRPSRRSSGRSTAPRRGRRPARGAARQEGRAGDAVGLVDGLYPGAAAAGFRNFPESKATKAPRISEVYTKGR